MKLPVIRIAGDERWDCQSCGACCRGSIIRLDEADLKNLHQQRWEESPEMAGQKLLVRDARAESGQRLAQRADGSCIFLTDENRCRIHEKFGAEAKPLVCRVFPLQLIPREKDAVLTLRRACPTAAADVGRPLVDHLPEVQRLVATGALTIPPLPSLAADPQAWQRAKQLLAAAARIFSDQRFPPVRRVMHVLLFARLLDRSKFAQLDDRKRAELIALVEPSLVSEAKAHFANRQPPKTWGGWLFRMAATEYARLHPDYRAPTGSLVRGKVLRSTWRMMRGRGALPALISTFPAATFDRLNEPLGALHPELLRPEIQRPIERYLATSAASYQYALANRGSWSILESIRALALTFPIALYLLRWATMGREPTAEDAAKIVCALDRGQGFAALAGARHRLVVNSLASQEDLERLVVWYAR